ncbi:hypothetical protein G5714_006209 [Onychostoma macrolepis]|uniref:Uncharacterized protein n=1 Tax=Onychostoma macrolepis TaxID=369639 RepID=A0A7J6D3D0_9TELE|nr:hypothetical protein G5714_006209 [Onychostoma macrolepis]
MCADATVIHTKTSWLDVLKGATMQGAFEILLSLLSGVETLVTHHKAHWGRARERKRTEHNHCIPKKKKKKKKMWNLRQKG